MQIWAFVGATLIGGALGAIVQYALSQRAERQRALQQRRTEAYVDLIKAVAALMTAPRDTPPDRLTATHALYSEARARVAVYGTSAVGAAFAKFLSCSLSSDEARGALIEVVQVMRAESAGADPIAATDLGPLLFAAND